MASVESDKDLIGFLLILQSMCAQNNGGMRVDEEYRNLITIQAAVSWRQDPKVDDATLADQIKDRYGSAIHTCGKFVFGQPVYNKVLANYCTPMTFKEYMLLSDADQIPINKIVKERCIAKLIIKNSLNDRARDQLSETSSKPNNGNKKKEEIAVVSYHDDVDTIDIPPVDDIILEDAPNDEPDIIEPYIIDINNSIIAEDKGIMFDNFNLLKNQNHQ
ncbi:hypothetical protein FRACYDRAFT_240586 [Fragilariopsis cylindrus CCMP1102]|uniref:Uncharacterized protein n=1 Tax=Fragilariopsis cylindrus CCMP1102 TaxID=635003 RepID=A0A1E7FCL1_9STRA|nr:hypothetical protein FRACYDRAFT_240586 [Fragilariopsis cylindrus CCMP1102]|eukprot:OEU15891.1 hypothetical protein FRACYDRAFT_240586 [Fragilariopsis cylindrus CCMP1102]